MTSHFLSRRVIAWVMAILGLAVVAFGVCEWQRWPFLKGPIERQLTTRLQRPIELGNDFGVRFFGAIRLSTDSLRVGPLAGQAPGAPLGAELGRAKGVDLTLPYSTVWNVWHGNDEPVHIGVLHVVEIEASLRRLADGRSNWALADRSRHNASTKPLELPTFGELVVERGHVTLDDAVLKTVLEAQVSTTEGDRAVANGAPARGLKVDGRGHRGEVPFEFHLSSAGALPLVSHDAAVAVPVAISVSGGTDAKFSFQGTGIDLLGFRSLDGKAMLSGSSLSTVGDALAITLPTTERFVLRGRLIKSNDTWSLNDINLAVGESHLGGHFRFDHGQKQPRLSGELTGSQLVLADLLPAFGAARPKTEKAEALVRKQGGRVLPQREFDIPSLHWMNADVKVRLARADLGVLFRQPLAPLEGDLTLEGGVLKLTNLLARAAGGQLKGELSLDGNRSDPLWTADLRWAGIELDQWLSPRNKTSQQPKPSGENPGWVTGRLGGHAKLQAHGKSTAAMIGSTSGTVQAWVRDGTISHLAVEAAGIDVAQAIGVFLIGDDPLPMHCAVFKANARGGQLVPEVAIVDTRDSTLFISGSVGLADERLALTLTSKPKDISPASLRSPVKVEGTFDHPQVHLEKKPIALKLLASAALAAVMPLAALLPFVDMGDKEAAGGCQRALQHLRDADGPAGARDAKAPKAMVQAPPAQDAQGKRQPPS